MVHIITFLTKQLQYTLMLVTTASMTSLHSLPVDSQSRQPKVCNGQPFLLGPKCQRCAEAEKRCAEQRFRV